ncbi:MAG: hypothetical protein Q7J85_07940 [Bacillota bacterium]|nr:hypothetical protein [Bacillota bacterium]
MKEKRSKSPEKRTKKMMDELGIKSVEEYQGSDSKQLLTGIKDIDYCKRFASKLDKEIEW